MSPSEPAAPVTNRHAGTRQVVVQVIGALLTAGSASLAGRLIWEQTVWSWERGPQMVGFSLAHGLGAFLFVFPMVLIGWLVIVAALAARRLLKRQHVSVVTYVELGVAALVLVALWLPYGFWQRAFIARVASSPRAVEFLILDSAAGDLPAVKALVAHGVPADGRDPRDGKTGLHGAAVAGQVSVIEYLVANGADVNAIDRWGNSPLEYAMSEKHEAAAQILANHGARRIRGDDGQRKKAAEDIVHEDSERLQRMRR